MRLAHVLAVSSLLLSLGCQDGSKPSTPVGPTGGNAGGNRADGAALDVAPAGGQVAKDAAAGAGGRDERVSSAGGTGGSGGTVGIDAADRDNKDAAKDATIDVPTRPDAGPDNAGGRVDSGADGAAGGAGGNVSPTKYKVWIAGDSTVANGSTPCPIGWGAKFQTLFDQNVTVVNSAVGGRSVRTWLYDVTTKMDSTGECVLTKDASGNPTVQDRWQAMLDGMKAGDYLFIQFGINDASATCDRHVGLAAFKESFAMMAKAAKARGTQPIFVTPASAIACSGSTAVGSRGGYVTATKEAGTQYDVPVIDLHQLTVDLYNSLKFCPVPGGDVSASTTGPVGDFFCDDHTHFSAIGAPQIAKLMATGIKKAGLGLAKDLLP